MFNPPSGAVWPPGWRADLRAVQLVGPDEEGAVHVDAAQIRSGPCGVGVVGDSVGPHAGGVLHPCGIVGWRGGAGWAARNALLAATRYWLQGAVPPCTSFDSVSGAERRMVMLIPRGLSVDGSV